MEFICSLRLIHHTGLAGILHQQRRLNLICVERGGIFDPALECSSVGRTAVGRGPLLLEPGAIEQPITPVIVNSAVRGGSRTELEFGVGEYVIDLPRRSAQTNNADICWVRQTLIG